MALVPRRATKYVHRQPRCNNEEVWSGSPGGPLEYHYNYGAASESVGLNCSLSLPSTRPLKSGCAVAIPLYSQYLALA